MQAKNFLKMQYRTYNKKFLLFPFFSLKNCVYLVHNFFYFFKNRCTIANHRDCQDMTILSHEYILEILPTIANIDTNKFEKNKTEICKFMNDIGIGDSTNNVGMSGRPSLRLPQFENKHQQPKNLSQSSGNSTYPYFIHHPINKLHTRQSLWSIIGNFKAMVTKKCNEKKYYLLGKKDSMIISSVMKYLTKT